MTLPPPVYMTHQAPSPAPTKTIPGSISRPATDKTPILCFEQGEGGEGGEEGFRKPRVVMWKAGTGRKGKKWSKNGKREGEVMKPASTKMLRKNLFRKRGRFYWTCLILHCQPELASRRGRLAPRHHPSSLFLIFFAILTSLSMGMP